MQTRDWWTELRAGELNIIQLAKRECLHGAYITLAPRPVFLSPAIIGAIVEGTQPAELSVQPQTIQSDVAQSWAAQATLRINWSDGCFPIIDLLYVKPRGELTHER